MKSPTNTYLKHSMATLPFKSYWWQNLTMCSSVLLHSSPQKQTAPLGNWAKCMYNKSLQKWVRSWGLSLPSFTSPSSWKSRARTVGSYELSETPLDTTCAYSSRQTKKVLVNGTIAQYPPEMQISLWRDTEAQNCTSLKDKLNTQAGARPTVFIWTFNIFILPVF